MGIADELKEQVILCIWIAAMAVAAVKYVITSTCPSNSEVAPIELSPSQKNAAVKRAVQRTLYEKLHENIRPYTQKVPTEEAEFAVGDIEEGTITSDGEEIIKPRMCSNACAICLEEFEEEEKVAYSCGKNECPHIFHEDCMKEVVAAAIRKDILSIPCPCCRQTFVCIEIIASEGLEKPDPSVQIEL